VSSAEDLRAPEIPHDVSEDAAGHQADDAASLPHEPPTPQPRILRLGRRDRARMHELNALIDSYPEAAVNFVERGELYLKAGELDAAGQDFEEAVRLSEAEYRASRFGLAAQVIRDRALAGLHAARG
jgi:tetratricopeptide (TPR) repeat protein